MTEPSKRIDRKVRDIIFEAILNPPGCYQNIQDNPEYDSILTFRIILKMFVVNMLEILYILDSYVFSVA